MSAQFPRGWNETGTYSVLCDDSTGCDKMGDYFATEADTMVDIVCEGHLKRDWL